jgi:hypothetical protein
VAGSSIVSAVNIEHGDFERVQIGTLRRYVEAVGGALRVEVELGDKRFQIASYRPSGPPRWRSAGPEDSESVLDIGGPSLECFSPAKKSVQSVVG